MLRRLFFVMFVIMATLVMTASSYAFVDNIVAAWTFDEDSGDIIHDVSANGNDGVLMGEPGLVDDVLMDAAEWVDGRFGGGLHFNGVTGYIEIPFKASMKVMNAGDFTFAAWFLADEIPTENKEVFQQGDGDGTGRTWLLVHNTNEIRSFVGGGTTGSGVPVEAGQWYHAAVVVTEVLVENEDTNNIQMYVNGAIAGEPAQRAMEDCEGPYFIGCHKDLINFWDGIIDEVVLLNKALDEAEVNSLMNNGLAVKPMGKLAVCWGGVKDIH